MSIRNRVREYRLVDPSEVAPNPRNWRLHPDRQRTDVARVGYRWGRPQHIVDYRPLRNVPLRLAPGVTPDDVAAWRPTAYRFEREVE